MIPIVLSALLAWLPVAPQPTLQGLATWYDPCQHHPQEEDRRICREMVANGLLEFHMANGEVWEADGLTMAVDRSRRDDWLNRHAFVMSECGKWVVVKVTDTGMLYDASWFAHGTDALGTARWWPVGKPGTDGVITSTVSVKSIEWSGRGRYHVVADFPRETYSLLACEKDWKGRWNTVVVQVWINDYP